MRKISIVSSIVLAAALAVAGCKKKEDESAAPKATDTAAPAAPTAPTAPTAPPAAPAAPAAAMPAAAAPAMPAPGGPEPFPGAKDLADKTMAMMGEIAAAAAANKDDCAKMGAALKSIIEKNADLKAKAMEMEKNEAAKAWFAANYQEKMMATMMPMAQNMQKCGDSPEVKGALESLAK